MSKKEAQEIKKLIIKSNVPTRIKSMDPSNYFDY